MGENGAGKSTLMKCLCGIYSFDEGEIILDGKNIKDVYKRQLYDQFGHAAFEEGAGNYGNAQGSPFGSGFGGAQGNPFGGGFHGSYSDGNGYHEYHFENGEDMDEMCIRDRQL